MGYKVVVAKGVSDVGASYLMKKGYTVISNAVLTGKKPSWPVNQPAF